MFIKIGSESYELNTKLGTAKRLEGRFKMPLSKLFENLHVAELSELQDIICIAANKNKDESITFKALMDESWDYGDIQMTVQEFILRMMYSGTDEEVEKKISKSPVEETEKNGMRQLLGLPLKETTGDRIQEFSTGEN